MVIRPGVVLARGVHHPAEENGDQDEGDEAAEKWPEHGAETYRAPPAGELPSAVESDLLLWRRERPGHLQAALLAKDEPHLTGRSQPLGVIGTVGRTRASLGQRTKVIAMKKAGLAAHLARCRAPVCHARPRPSA